MATAPTTIKPRREMTEVKAPEMFKFTKHGEILSGVLLSIEPTTVEEQKVIEYMVQDDRGMRITFLGTNDLNNKIHPGHIGHWLEIRYERDESSFQLRRMNRLLAVAIMMIVVVATTFGKDNRAVKNKEIVRKVFIDIWTQGRFEVANEIYAKDFVNHAVDNNISFERDQADIHGWRAAFPDIELFVEKEFAEGDFVTVLWRGRGTNTGSGNGLPATGKKTDGRGISIFRVVDGKIKEEWTEYSQMLILRQLGLFPPQH